MDDIKVWETKCRYRLPELFTLSDIAVWFDAHWPMGERPVVRVAYLIQAHRVRPSALHNGERLYSRQAVETLWGLLTEVRPSEARFESEDVAFHEYLQTGVPATADCAADPYWMVGHQANGNTGGIIAEEMEIPELPERPAPSEDEGEDNE